MLVFGSTKRVSINRLYSCFLKKKESLQTVSKKELVLWKNTMIFALTLEIATIEWRTSKKQFSILAESFQVNSKNKKVKSTIIWEAAMLILIRKDSV